MPQAARPVAAVILAAGHGKRMKSDLLKVLHPIGGRPMVEHVLRAARGAGVERCLVVVGHQAERVRETLGDSVEYVLQAEQRGTGHAVLQAESAVRGGEAWADDPGDLLVLYGDNPLLTPEIIRDLLDEHRRSGADATALTAVMEEPSGLGRILRDASGRYLRTVEEKDATPEQLQIKEVMSGIFCFRLPLLFQLLHQLTPDNQQGEYYLVDVLGQLVAQGRPVAISIARDPSAVIGPNTRQGLAQAEAVLRRRVLERWMDEGVTIVDPATTYIHDTVTIGRDTVIEPFTFLQGDTQIGSHCRIGPHARIVDSRVADGATVDSSVVEQSAVGPSARVGPFAHLRPRSVIGERAEIGNYAETKNAVVGAGTKVHHHCYLGDVTLGERVNIGAGTVIVNYDGVAKHHSQIDDGAFIGCNSNLISPVRVGAGSYVAAGSTVNRDVPAGALAIARERQVNKEGYAGRLHEAHRRRPAGSKPPEAK